MTEFKNPYLDEYNKIVKTAQDKYKAYRQGEITADQFYGEEHAFERRQRLVNRYAWALPDENAIDEIVKRAGKKEIVEIGAGTGYWAWLLTQKGAEVVAFDIEKRAEPFCHVNQGTEHKAADASHLFLCWPMYDRPVARRALDFWAPTMKKGNFLFYVGEWRGCTGDDDFHDRIMWLQERGFLGEETTITIPQWDCIHDQLFIYEVMKDG